jgi:hypothetical protein
VSEFSAATGASAAVLDPVTRRQQRVLYRACCGAAGRQHPDHHRCPGVPADDALPIGVLDGHFTALPGSMADHADAF